MTAGVDVEIGLHYGDSEFWRAELRFEHQASDADPGPLLRTVPRLDLDQLRSLSQDPVAYGRRLTETLFSDAQIKEKFLTARRVAENNNVPLRIRLFIGPSVPELHDIRWETLRDPERDAPLLTSERTLFSRYLSSFDWRPIRVRPRARLTALVAIANPTDLDGYRPDGRPLGAIRVGPELERIRDATKGLELLELPSSGTATLEEITGRLREGVDVLLLVCHGYFVRGDPVLLLENSDQTTARVPGGALVQRLRDLQTLPRLVVLVSCQSAGAGDDSYSADNGALAALGPRLAEAGIPAVLAMLGNISMPTIARFLPAFFRALQVDGQIDRAVAVARGEVRERPDWTVPVLFLRLKSGRIWYTPGFAGGGRQFERWPALFSDIERGKCTPILGPGMTDSLLGSRQEIAWRWSSQYHFPMRPYDREDLPHVAQYLAVSQGPRFPRFRLGEHLRLDLLKRYRLPPERAEDSLDGLLSTIAAARRRDDPAEPHQVLASLPCPIYITTQPTNLLHEALDEKGKKPRDELFRWKELTKEEDEDGDEDEDDDGDAWPQSVFDTDPGYKPNTDKPLVYHLFGRLDIPESLVLTEDDYFDFLVGVKERSPAIPSKVRRVLSDSSLLFLGFRMDEWDFRVLFRGLMNLPGQRRREGYAHVLAQIDPEESTTLEPERARRYMEDYVVHDRVSVYWGTVEDFTRDLQEGWDRWQRERR
jgi:hypothetical protein